MHLRVSQKTIAEMDKESLLKLARKLRTQSTNMRKESVEIEREARRLEIRAMAMI